MLARPSTVEKFETALRLPPLPSDVEAAVASLNESTERVTAADALVRDLSAKLRPGMDAADQRALQAKIAAANAKAIAHREEQTAALNRRDAAKRDFAAHVDQVLADDVVAWQHAITDRLAELDDLLALGHKLDEQVKSARIAIKAKSITGASHLRGLIQPIRSTFAAWSR
ncbi:MAG: hypothetical protein JNK47_02865 [Mesorhizobium sp.]|nr:hypothetical protein [Mesorhizobium sp.]MBL8576142.1 hypothetical protein [Mesorhizobium sp.]